MGKQTMRYTRQFIQFNNLVFDGVDMVQADDISHDFKRNRTAYTTKHGDYSPNRKVTYLESAKFSMTILLRMKKVPCDVRNFYYDFALGQLAESGKLWAVHNNTLEWAYAELDTFGDNHDAKKDTLEIDVSVTLTEGVWHKADKQKTFLVPWNVCDFLDCEGFREVNPCASENGQVGSCCSCHETMDLTGCCCDCVEKEHALCYNQKELQSVYSCDGHGFRVIYNCEAGERYFSSDITHTGQKLCGDCGFISGRLYSDTVLPTEDVKIFLHGHVVNPYIEINGNANQIRGEYDDLTIYPDGTVTYGCDECKEIDVNDWVIPSGNQYGWVVHQGNNRVMIETGNCCGMVCAYFEVGALTL